MCEKVVSCAAAWEQKLAALLPLFGHRNWIVVADSAYAIRASIHVREKIYLDKELDAVDEADAPGIADYRERLTDALYGASVTRMLHEQIIHKLDQSAKLVRILIIKTEMTIPYTSVFFELDCGYWNAEAEERLREAMPEVESK